MVNSNKTERNKIVDETFNNLADNFIKVLNEALAKKDAIIRGLEKKIKDLENQNSDLDYLITSGKDELKKDLRQRIKSCKCRRNIN